MRKTSLEVLGLFDELHQARQSLQGEFTACLKEFYALARRSALTARAFRARDGAIRAVYLAMRLKGTIRRNGRRIRLLKHIKGRINRGLIYKVARDYRHLEMWLEADAVRTAINARSALVNLAARDLDQALARRFASRASDPDRLATAEILRTRPGLAAVYPAVLGLAVYDRHVSSLEDRIAALVGEWKRELPDLAFEPLIRWREGGGLRLSWCFVEHFYDAAGLLQVRSTDIPGGVTDRWLRSQPSLGSARRRKAALLHVKGLRLPHRAYSELLVWAGRLKAKVHRALTMAALTEQPADQKDVG